MDGQQDVAGHLVAVEGETGCNNGGGERRRGVGGAGRGGARHLVALEGKAGCLWGEERASVMMGWEGQGRDVAGVRGAVARR